MSADEAPPNRDLVPVPPAPLALPSNTLVGRGLALAAHLEGLAESSTYAVALNRHGQAGGTVEFQSDGRRLIRAGENADFISGLMSFWQIAWDKVPESDRLIFLRHMYLSELNTQVEHREMFSLAMLHLFLELKESHASVPDAVAGVVRLLPECALPPLPRSLSDEIRSLLLRLYPKDEPHDAQACINAKRADDPPPEVKAVFEKIRRFLSDEAAQNQLYEPEFQRLIDSGRSVDHNAGTTGEFGRDPRNAIPVNGFIGELLYVSQLVVPTGSHMMGHRLGAMGNIDVYEVVSFDGTCWDLLYFDMYHPRKSRRPPVGFRLEADGFVLATNQRLPEFPQGIREAISRCTKGFLGVPLVSPKIHDEGLARRLSRPPSQASAINALRLEAPRT